MTGGSAGEIGIGPAGRAGAVVGAGDAIARDAATGAGGAGGRPVGRGLPDGTGGSSPVSTVDGGRSGPPGRASRAGPVVGAP
jgi:hypothetical protein